MIVYLVRHGEAFPEEKDPARPLTERGRAEVEQTARDLLAEGAKIDEIWRSTKLRARQTAEIIAQILGVKTVLEEEGLNPNDPAAPIAEMIKTSGKTVLIAGHMPFLGKLASFLKTGSENKEVGPFYSGGGLKISF